MKVLCIVFPNTTSNVIEVLEMTDEDKDDLFIKWLRENSLYYSDKSREECLKAPYSWKVRETKRIS